MGFENQNYLCLGVDFAGIQQNSGGLRQETSESEQEHVQGGAERVIELGQNGSVQETLLAVTSQEFRNHKLFPPFPASIPSSIEGHVSLVNLHMENQMNPWIVVAF